MFDPSMNSGASHLVAFVLPGFFPSGCHVPMGLRKLLPCNASKGCLLSLGFELVQLFGSQRLLSPLKFLGDKKWPVKEVGGCQSSVGNCPSI